MEKIIQALLSRHSFLVINGRHLLYKDCVGNFDKQNTKLLLGGFVYFTYQAGDRIPIIDIVTPSGTWYSLRKGAKFVRKLSEQNKQEIVDRIFNPRSSLYEERTPF